MRLGVSRQGEIFTLVSMFVAMASVFLLAVTIPWSAANAAFAGVNGKIAFMSTRDGDAEIYVMNGDEAG